MRSNRFSADGCPCSIWTPAATPANPAVTDGQPIEVGVKFRSDTDGFITALHFYKGTANGGSHVVHLWSATGALLALVPCAVLPTAHLTSATYVLKYHTGL